MEHVEVLRHMKETIKAIMPSEVAALDAAIAALSAQQPAAVDGDYFDCPHSAFDNCDCYADQQGGES